MHVPIHKEAKYWIDATTDQRQFVGSVATTESYTSVLNDGAPQDQWHLDQRCAPNHGMWVLLDTEDPVMRVQC